MTLAELLAGKKLTARSKIWLELDGKAFLGAGRYAMLRSIDRYGSIKRASEETGISYRRIRGAIYIMEKALGIPLVVRSRGGATGGGASLSEAARELMRFFEKHAEGVHGRGDDFHRIAFGPKR